MLIPNSLKNCKKEFEKTLFNTKFVPRISNKYILQQVYKEITLQTYADECKFVWKRYLWVVLSKSFYKINMDF